MQRFCYTHCSTPPRIWRSLLLAVAALSATSAALAQQPVINEVQFWEEPANPDPTRSNEWVEIYNPGPATVDLTGWTVTDRTGVGGAAAFTLPNVQLPAGAYLRVIHAAGVDDVDFSDGCGEIYTGLATVLGDASDEAGLYDAANSIVDFIAWHDSASGAYVPGTAHDDAVAAAQWTADAFFDTDGQQDSPTDRVRFVRPGETIGRDQNSTDTDTTSDWDVTGGVDADDNTPCAQNLTQRFVGLGGGGGGGGQPKEWTIMVYIAGDNNLEEFAFKDLNEIERAGGSDANVNIVVMVDSWRVMQQANVVGGLFVPVPNTKGGAWRFQVRGDNDDRIVYMHVPAGQDPFVGAPTNVLPDPNTGAPGTLASFIQWSAANYPADRYGLVMWNHGAGWKGICEDETVGAVDINPNEWIYMNELSAALGAGGVNFELIGFDACLMAMVEVAWQVQPFAKYFVASQELEPGDGWPYDQWVAGLKANPGWNGAQLGTRIVNDYDAFYSAAPNAVPWRTLSVTRLRPDGGNPGITPLINAITAFGADLEAGSDDINSHATPDDNVQIRIAIQRNNSDGMDDDNYRDLSDFADFIQNDGIIPACYRDEAPNVIAEVGNAVVANQVGPSHVRSKGLTIYFPQFRTSNNPYGACGCGAAGDPYDYPWPSRVDTHDSPRAQYAANLSCLPNAILDIELPAFDPLHAAPTDFPLITTPAFRFPVDTAWHSFLQRFFHPAADNQILFAICPGGSIVFPSTVDGPCGNPVDTIVLCPGCTVFFEGGGSSDADTFIGGGQDILPRHYSWDFDGNVDSVLVPLFPDTVPPGADAFGTALDDMDAGIWCGDAADDEKESTAVAPSRGYPDPGFYPVTLTVWDDNDNFVFHDTNPTADYVHPQPDKHVSNVIVLPCPWIPPLIPPTITVPPILPVPETTITQITVVVTESDGTPITGLMVSLENLTGNFTALTSDVDDNGLPITWTDANGVAVFDVSADSEGIAEFNVLSYVLNQSVPGAFFILRNNCPGDLNGDGIVDSADLNILLSNWGCIAPPACLGDLNNDGVVDSSDLNILLSNWGPCPPPPPLGACCLPTGNCVETTRQPCLDAGGTWTLGATCDDVDCGDPIGACCLSDGTCFEGPQQECDLAGGFFYPNTPCTQAPCQPLDGACCLPDGGCFTGPDVECFSAGGQFFPGLTCVDVDCQPTDFGACCLPDGTCFEGPQSDCIGSGGQFFPGLSCNQVTCEPIVGACCLDQFTCQDLTQAECLTLGGQFTAGATCAEITCAPTGGACCLPDGTCFDGPQSECIAAGGQFFPGIPCFNDPCQPTGGACCLGFGECVQTDEMECVSLGGVFFPGQNCGQVCLTSGACCVGVECFETTADDCVSAGGQFFPGQTCTPTLCFPETGACCLSSGGCVETTDQNCLDQGGLFFPNVPCADAGCPGSA